MASSPNVKKHQQLFKAGSPASSWKETFRKRCINRLRESREKFVGRLRNLDTGDSVQDLMSTEYETLQQEHGGLPRLKKNSLDIENDEAPGNIDEILSVFEEVQKELLREEQLMLEEYERNQQLVDADLCDAISSMCNELVVCPICQKHHLMQNRNIIFCKCGVRIDTQLDCLNISDLRTQLTEGNQFHSRTCSATPVYSIADQLGFSNLLMTCSVCDFMFVVI